MLTIILGAVDEIVSVKNLLHRGPVLVELDAARDLDAFLRGSEMGEGIWLCYHGALALLIYFRQLGEVLSLFRGLSH